MRDWILDWLFFHTKKRRLSLISASDETHSRSLLQFIVSATAQKMDRNLIIFDLGLTDESLQKIKIISPNIDVRKFDYSRYPSWFDIKVNAGEYAWKPVIINEIMQENGGIIIWMDAGNVIVGHLHRLHGSALRAGLFSQTSSGDLARWTHPRTLDHFGKDKEWATGKKNINGACIAIDAENEFARRIVSKWAELAQIKDVIAPLGSSRENHRQDQALLSTLLNLERFKITPRSQKSLNFVIHRDVDP
ncbi:DUF1647 domain-containing protein [Agrobacterium vaccinii]|uniref:DUF1647 domain-containing protein n=1 Tax=Agrobacterium vaccinii TaxID=2735528 RepID=UPI001E6145DB|nr:DUF1647 domain-containing protein [Agrobacterium vaccinii]UHS57109.1 DUF1647 domain-containing protein [Agrobacterium vaccinii]